MGGPLREKMGQKSADQQVRGELRVPVPLKRGAGEERRKDSKP